jgi:hypothetical protein
MMITTLEPQYELWGEVLQSNLNLQARLDATLGAKLRKQIRDGVIQEAARHTKALQDLAHDLGIPLMSSSNPSVGQHQGPIIMSGHQPVLYHRGLAFKSEMLAKIASDTGGIGVHVVVDTDQGDGGAIVWPRLVHESLELRRGTLVAETGPDGATYTRQRLASREKIAALFEEIENDLRHGSLVDAADRVRRMRPVYERLANQPVSVAHAIARWSVRPLGYREVLLSDIVANTRLREVIRELVSNGAHLAEAYNSSLDEHRVEHRIENRANPFPNLKVSETSAELPLWSIDDGIRRPVYVERVGSVHVSPSSFYAPRGSITTLLLRGYCSDMFIHGLGGKRYDTFVDRFAQRYWGVSLPSFVVASETRYMFPLQVERLTREITLASQFKEILSRTESFLGQGIFSDEEERTLRGLLDNRNQLRAKMQQIQSDEERRPLALALNDSNRRVRQVLEASSLSSLRERAASNEVELAKWKFREFPFFMFGW